jgi:hypothetical protein
VTDNAPAFVVGIVDDDLDRVHALDRTTTGRSASARELGELSAQVVVERLVKAHPHEAVLVRGQTETVKADSDVHASAYQPSRAIGATQAAMLLGSRRVHRE